MSKSSPENKKSIFKPNSLERLLSSAVRFTKPSKTVQSAEYDTDINNMVRGLTPFTQSSRPSFYIDESVFCDSYEEHFNRLLQAQDDFMQLPPEIREKFNNDPAELANALGDPSMRSELVKLGLLEGGDDVAPQAGEVEPPQNSDAEST